LGHNGDQQADPEHYCRKADQGIQMLQGHRWYLAARGRKRVGA
jgi:hypothetical protein